MDNVRSYMATDRQLEVLEYIRAHQEKYRMPPTRAEIARHFGWSSANAAQLHVEALERKGLIEFLPGKARGIIVVGD